MAGGQERVLRRRIQQHPVDEEDHQGDGADRRVADRAGPGPDRRRPALPAGDGPHRARDRARATREAAGRLLGAPESVAEGRRARPSWPTAGCAAATTRSVLRATERLLAGGPTPGIECRLFTVGKKAQSYFRFRGQPVEQSFIGISERPTFDDARDVAAAVITPFVAGEVDQVLIVSDPVPLGRDPAGRGPPAAPPDRSPGGRDRPPRPSGRGNAVHDRRGDRPAGYTEFEPDAAILLETLAPRAAETGDLRRPARGLGRRSSPPASGPWPRPPTTPTS